MVGGSLIAVLVCFAGPASAEQRTVSEAGAWRAVIADEAGRRSCFVVSTPTTRLPAGLKRDPGFAFLTLRGRDLRAGTEFSARFGFPLSEAGHVLTIDGADYRLLARAELAWLADPADEAGVQARLRAAREARLVVRSARGNATTDVYDLTGLSATVDELGRQCGR
jgi:hypothetical protein